jgi:adenylosuccinate synthase
MIPSGFLYEKSRLLIGPGVLVNPKVLLEEVEVTQTKNRLGVDNQCAIIEQKHIDSEKSSAHLTGKVGTTKSGVGPCNADRALRLVKVARDVPELKDLLADVPGEIHDVLKRDGRVLVEGSQGTFLSVFHGTYPYCTTKDVCASAVCSDVGIGPTDVDQVLVVFKSYVTRVGGGSDTLEGVLSEEEAKKRGWQEYGTVTGRPRRAAPFNYGLAARACRLNGATQIALTKVDTVYPSAKGVRTFDQLPAEAKDFVAKIEREMGVPVTLLGTGPDSMDVVDRAPELLHTV